MSARLIAAVVVGLLTFTALSYQAGEAETGLSVTVTAEAVGITISGGGTYDFGGPWGPGVVLKAHPDISQTNVVGMPPTITNSGNVPITNISVSYGGPSGQEASCDSGAGHWAAHTAPNAAQDQFRMRAWASNHINWSNFNSTASVIAPNTGTPNILQLTSSPLEAESSIPLLLELRMPSPIVAGGGGCTIELIVTASAL